MTEQATPTGHKPPRGRSPSYPGITLDAAIKRAESFYGKYKTHPTPITLVTKVWGYKAHTTGPASVTYAALMKYGLMTDEGNGDARMATLTDLAVTILETPHENERNEAIRTAALKPPIHADMWREYGADLPDDNLLRYKMVTKGPFTEAGFADFIRVYRDVIAFAKLGSGEKVPEVEPEPEDGGDGDATDENPLKDPARHHRQIKRPEVTTGTQTIAVPMIGAPAVMIEGQFPLTEQDWQYFMTVLTAMKPGLVAEDQQGKVGVFKSDEPENDD